MEVRLGEHVILRGSDGFTRCVQVTEGGTVKINKRSTRVRNLAGCSYGSIFDSLNGEFVTTTEPLHPQMEDILDQNEGEDAAAEEEKESVDGGRNNRTLVDDNTSQSLSQTEILAFRASGLSGRDIISKLCESSATFSSKTRFSQMKYLRKKQKKYICRVQVLPCNGFTLCKQIAEKSPGKIHHLRTDQLGRILCALSLTAGQKILVYENMMGFLTGCIVERLQGLCTIYSLWDRPGPCQGSLPRFNLSEAQRASILNVHYASLVGQSDPTLRVEEVSAHSVLEAGVDSLLIAHDRNCVAATRDLLRFLAIGRPFVVYSNYLTELVEIYGALKNGGQSVNMELSEVFFRRHQVLPSRTHPEMSMNNRSGYLLTGLKVGGKSSVEHERPEGAIGDSPSSKRRRTSGEGEVESEVKEEEEEEKESQVESNEFGEVDVVVSEETHEAAP